MEDHWKTVSQETYVPHAAGVQVRAAAVRRANEIAETNVRLQNNPKFTARSNSELSFAPPIDPVLSKKCNPKRKQDESQQHSSPERKFNAVSTASDTYRPAPQELLVASLVNRVKHNGSPTTASPHREQQETLPERKQQQQPSSMQSESRRAFVSHNVRAVHRRHDRDRVLPPRTFDSVSTYQGTFGHADS